MNYLVDFKGDLNVSTGKVFWLSIVASLGFMIGGLMYKGIWLVICSLVKCGS